MSTVADKLRGVDSAPVAPVDMTTTAPAERAADLAAGDLFIREIVTQGQVLYAREPDGPGPDQEQLLALARERGYVNTTNDPLTWVSRAEADYTGAQKLLR